MEKQRIVFISSWHETPGRGGVHAFCLRDDGKPVGRGFLPLVCAGYLAFNRRRDRLYATCRADASGDGAAAFAVDADGGFSALGGIVPSGGRSTCHLSVAPGEKYLYAANYLSGSFSEYLLDGDGAILRCSRIIRHEGSGPNAERQEMAHPHCCVFSPAGDFLAVADLGCDTVSCYPFSPESGIDEAHPVVNHLVPGSGPRHILFDPGSRFAYVINELGNSVSSFVFDAGRLCPVDELSLLPRGAECPTKAAALRFSADRKFLVCSNRGFDSLCTVSLGPGGRLSAAALTLSGGSSPRDVNFVGDGSLLAAGNEFSDEVRFFDFDAASGRLSPNGYRLEMPRPLCILPLCGLQKA